MDIVTEKYVRKPLYVDAVRVTEENFKAIAKWCQGIIETPEDERPFVRVRVHSPKHPRQTMAMVGDWILYTEMGYKVYSNKAFTASFDLLDPEETPNKVVAVRQQVG